jgi:hypothetical protein
VPVGVISLGLLGFLFFRSQRKNRPPEYSGPPTAAEPTYKDYFGSPPTGLEVNDKGGFSSPGQQSSMSELAGHGGQIPQVRYEMPAGGAYEMPAGGSN